MLEAQYLRRRMSALVESGTEKLREHEWALTWFPEPERRGSRYEQR
jgi:hypothetical protein